MRTLIRFLLTAAFILMLVMPLSAQDDDLIPVSGTYQYVEYTSVADCGFLSGTRTLEQALDSETFQSTFSVFVLDGGETVLLVFDADDYVFTITGEPGVYTGSLFNPAADAVSEVTLTVVDDARLVAAETYIRDEDCRYDYEIAYEFVDETTAELWTETEREFSNFTFPACLGLMGADEPFGVWIRNDWFVPIVRLEDGDLQIGVNVYERQGGAFSRSTDTVIADSNHHYEWTLTPVDDDTYTLDFMYQVDERDDCAVINQSQLVRVDLEDADLLAELLAPPEVEGSEE